MMVQGPTGEVGQPVHQLCKGLADSLQLNQKQPAVISHSVQHIQAAFGDLLAPLSPSGLITPLGGGDKEREARLWDTFADVFEQELRHLQDNSQEPVCKEKKRQILADILVWAEITQSHYDTHTASFVISPHCSDDSFQRIGRLFKTAKQQRGLA